MRERARAVTSRARSSAMAGPPIVSKSDQAGSLALMRSGVGQQRGPRTAQEEGRAGFRGPARPSGATATSPCHLLGLRIEPPDLAGVDLSDGRLDAIVALAFADFLVVLAIA